MEGRAVPPLRSFNPQALIENVGEIRKIIQRIRQKEGVGSEEDELTLHRAIHDLDLLVDIVDGLKAACGQQVANTEKLITSLETKERELVSLKDTYERILSEKQAIIDQLNQQLEQ